MWANFAKCGNPSTKDFLWKKFDVENYYCMKLGDTVELFNYTSVFPNERTEIMKPLVNKYIPYDYISLSFNVPTVRRILFFLFCIVVLIIAILIKLFK